MRIHLGDVAEPACADHTGHEVVPGDRIVLPEAVRSWAALQHYHTLDLGHTMMTSCTVTHLRSGYSDSDHSLEGQSCEALLAGRSWVELAPSRLRWKGQLPSTHSPVTGQTMSPLARDVLSRRGYPQHCDHP